MELKTTDLIGHEIKAINQVIQRKIFSSVANAGIDKITVMHGWIMEYPYKNRKRDVYQKDIESEFAISRSTVTNIVKLMEKKGYIKRASVESDARLKKIILTDKGIETYKLIRQTIIDDENRFNSLLTDEERNTFFDLIRKLRSGIENS